MKAIKQIKDIRLGVGTSILRILKSKTGKMRVTTTIIAGNFGPELHDIEYGELDALSEATQKIMQRRIFGNYGRQLGIDEAIMLVTRNASGTLQGTLEELGGTMPFLKPGTYALIID